MARVIACQSLIFRTLRYYAFCYFTLDLLRMGTLTVGRVLVVVSNDYSLCVWFYFWDNRRYSIFMSSAQPIIWAEDMTIQQRRRDLTKILAVDAGECFSVCEGAHRGLTMGDGMENAGLENDWPNNRNGKRWYKTWRKRKPVGSCILNCSPIEEETICIAAEHRDV